jgi:predicted nucleic acid-binding protein
MSAAEAFFDTNILLYLVSGDAAKADRAEALVAQGGTVSTQVLNEFASVAGRKLGLAVPAIREILATVRQVCRVTPLDEAAHDLALDVMERHRFAFYDALIVAAALNAGCAVLYTEDLSHGQRIDRRLMVRDPFRA